MNKIFHITQRNYLDTAEKSGWYEPPRYVLEGFIHCSFLEQVVAVSNRLFQNQTNLVLLEIDPQKLDCEIITENLEGGSELFPHIYGRLPWTAVSTIHTFSTSTSNQFQLPESVMLGITPS